jgi:ribonuclease BN (tRNA processing enzyme)
MKICFFGTSSAIPSAGNGYTSFVAQVAGRVVLVDSGDNAVSRMFEVGIDPMDFDALVLTHEHADHLGAFPGLIAALDCMGRSKRLAVILPPSLKERVLKLLSLFDYYPETLHFELSFASSWEAPGIHVELLPGNHSDFTMMVKFTAENQAFLYTSDISYQKGHYAVHGSGCAALIHEATYPHRALPEGTRHSSALEAGMAGMEMKAKSLFLCHLQGDAYSSPSEPADEASRAFTGSVIVPRLMQWYEIQKN